MFKSIRKAGWIAALAAGTLLAVSPASARDRPDGDNDAAIAVAAGIAGLAIGAALASDDDHRHYRRGRYYRDDRYYDRGYYYDRGRYYDRGYYRDYRRGYYNRDSYRRHHRDYRGDRYERRHRDWHHKNRRYRY
ncbi:MAG: hypothetical protein WCY11_16010 [Novosphingobium sp.]